MGVIVDLTMLLEHAALHEQSMDLRTQNMQLKRATTISIS
jgi:hypothetical protein